MSELLPSNQSPLESNLEQVTDLTLEVGIGALWNAKTCPVHLLPYLAWSLSVDEWDSAWPETTKRTAILNALNIHRQKGTVAAVKSALQSLGFGGNSKIIEGAETQYYSGVHFADGSQEYGGASWAKYQAIIDLGETQGIQANTSSLLTSRIKNAAPVRSHLTQIGFKAEISDHEDTQENTKTALYLTQSDLTPWLAKYDGFNDYNQGRPVKFDGALRFDGRFIHTPSQRGGDSLLIQQQEACTTQLNIQIEDAQRITREFNGLMAYDGHATETVVAEDADMPITLTRHHLHNGRKTYGDGWNFYAGNVAANGRYSYANTANTYSGNKVTYLQA